MGACSGTLQVLSFERSEDGYDAVDGGAGLAALVAGLTAAPVPAAGTAGAAAAPAGEAAVAPLASVIPLLLLPSLARVCLPLSVPQQQLPPDSRMRKAQLLAALRQLLHRVQGLRAAGSMVQECRLNTRRMVLVKRGCRAG